MIYLYRHYIEIELKKLIKYGMNITDTPSDKKIEEILYGHNLMKLWHQFELFFAEVCGDEEDFEGIKKAMESYINQIHKMDSEGITFRYDRGKNSKLHTYNDMQRINMFHFCKNIEKLTNLMESIDSQFSNASDYANDIRREYECN